MYIRRLVAWLRRLSSCICYHFPSHTPISSPVFPNPQIQITASRLCTCKSLGLECDSAPSCSENLHFLKPQIKIIFSPRKFSKKSYGKLLDKGKMLRMPGRNKQYILLKRRNVENKRFWESWTISFYNLKKFSAWFSVHSFKVFIQRGTCIWNFLLCHNLLFYWVGQKVRSGCAVRCY